MNSQNLNTVVESRHSGRNFDPTRKVTDTQLKELVHAAQFAPSCFNEQPWRFLICDKATHQDSFQKVWSTLAPKNQEWAEKAPVLIVVNHDTQFNRNGSANRWGPYDSGASALQMALKATELGLMAHQMGGFDEKKIAEIFEIPSRYIPIAVMAVGYENATNEKPPKKDRKPIEENFFLGKWGAGFKI